MKKILRIAIILAVIGAVAAALVWKFYVNKPHDDIEKATPAYSMVTEEIWSKYNTNRKTADSLYNNQVIELSGSLSRIDKNDSLVSVIFVMAADSMFGDKTIACQMYKKHNEEATALPVGAKIKIKGVCVGYDDTDIKFNKCSIVK
jgi:Na+-translocating ferredoxin:NAD+ oxidoreductase RnfG subunit